VTLPPRCPPPARPDLADRLLAAVAERDHPMAERLVQQWVHRRGLGALNELISGPLRASQGVEAAAWLQERAGLLQAPSVQLQPVAEPDRPQTPPAAHAARVWPQFRVVPGGIAAPAPSSLQPLRAWLPDAEEPEADAHHGVGSAADPLPLAS
jgi:hypothetical protein